jgi:hypothetical protein
MNSSLLKILTKTELTLQNPIILEEEKGFLDYSSNECLYNGLFKDGYLFGEWWKITFIGIGLKEDYIFNDNETIKSLLPKLEKYSIILSRTGYFDFLYLYSTYFVINSHNQICKHNLELISGGIVQIINNDDIL